MRATVPLLEFDQHGDIHFVQSGTRITLHVSIPGVFIHFLLLDEEVTPLKRQCVLFRYILHQISLLLSVVVYVILGGLFFALVESDYYLKREDERREIIQEAYESIRVYAMQLLNDQLNDDFEHAYHAWRWQSHASANYILLNDRRASLFDNHTELMLEAMTLRLAMQHVPVDKYVYKWTYSTAILYAATLVTTIGYGNISPKTAAGKILTVICRRAPRTPLPSTCDCFG